MPCATVEKEYKRQIAAVYTIMLEEGVLGQKHASPMFIYNILYFSILCQRPILARFVVCALT